MDLWALFAEHDVNVISLREKFDTSMPTGEAMVQLIMVFAQLERKMTAERTFSIMRDRADRGLWNGGHVLGYRSKPDDRGKLEIDPEGAEIVRRIFDLPNPGPETTNGAVPVEGNGSAGVNPERLGSHNRSESSARRIRTFNPPVNSRQIGNRNTLPGIACGDSGHSLAPQLAHQHDPDLGPIVAAWPDLPEHIRQAMMALVRSSRLVGTRD